MSFTFTSLQRPSGEQERLATTAFSLPEEVPEMLRAATSVNSYQTRTRQAHLLNQTSWMYVFDGYLAQSSALVM